MLLLDDPSQDLEVPRSLEYGIENRWTVVGRLGPEGLVMISEALVVESINRLLDASTLYTNAYDHSLCVLVFCFSFRVIHFDEVGYEGIGECIISIHVLVGRLALELKDYFFTEKVRAQDIGTLAIGIYVDFTLGRATKPL